jgi:CcmD family protein
MPADATTFLLAFLAVFGGLAAYLWHLDRAARRLEARLATLEAATAKPKAGDAAAPDKA